MNNSGRSPVELLEPVDAHRDCCGLEPACRQSPRVNYCQQPRSRLSVPLRLPPHVVPPSDAPRAFSSLTARARIKTPPLSSGPDRPAETSRAIGYSLSPRQSWRADLRADHRLPLGELGCGLFAVAARAPQSDALAANRSTKARSLCCQSSPARRCTRSAAARVDGASWCACIEPADMLLDLAHRAAVRVGRGRKPGRECAEYAPTMPVHLAARCAAHGMHGKDTIRL